MTGPTAAPTNPGSENRAELRIAVAGGGTGGHLFPALAALEALRKRAGRLEVLWLATTRAIDSDVLSRHGIRYQPQPARPFSVRPWKWPAFWWAWRRSVRLASRTLRDFRPHVVLGTGGYACGPAVTAGHRLGVPTCLLNPDARPGLANRVLSRKSTKVFVQWEVTLRHFKRPQAALTGCPVRQGFLSLSKERGCEHLGLCADQPVLLVTGASQGARNINLAVLELAGWLCRQHPDWQVLHLTGQADYELIRRKYKDLPGFKAIAFTQEMPAAMAAADLVISRAGASSLAEITAAGKAAVLMPYPYDRQRHQYANAAVLREAGAAVVVEDRKDPQANAEGLRQVLQVLLAKEDKRIEMAEASRRLGRPDAAERVAEAILALAEA